MELFAGVMTPATDSDRPAVSSASVLALTVMINAFPIGPCASQTPESKDIPQDGAIHKISPLYYWYAFGRLAHSTWPPPRFPSRLPSSRSP